MDKELTTFFPDELTRFPHWVVSNNNKIPISPATGEYASKNEPATWGTFEQAMDALAILNQVIGVAFCLTGSGIVGIDFDDCVVVGGVIAPHAKAIIDYLDSYTTFSISGAGLHVYCKAEISHLIPGKAGIIANQPFGVDGGIKQIEIFHSKFLTETGLTVPGLPLTINERQSELEQLINRLKPPPKRLAPKRLAPKPGQGAGAIRYAVNRVTHAGEGERNNMLNRMTFWLTRIDNVSHSEIESAMTWAGEQAGLRDNEVTATIRSALTAGGNGSSVSSYTSHLDTPKAIGEYHCKCGGMAAAYSDDSIQCPGCNRRWQDFAEFMTRSFPLPDTESTRNRLRSRHSEAEISQILGERQ